MCHSRGAEENWDAQGLEWLVVMLEEGLEVMRSSSCLEVVGSMLALGLWPVMGFSGEAIVRMMGGGEKRGGREVKRGEER